MAGVSFIYATSDKSLEMLLDDIKNDPKKKAGAIGIGGIVAIIGMMMILLLVVSSADGGAVVPVRGKFR